MNPLTQIKNTIKATKREIEAGIADTASWHAQFKHSAYVFAGGLDYELTEGDLLAVFSQYGEIVDLNLIRHKDTGKSKGFAFVAYEDQRSTVIAVDNLNGARVVGRTIRVEHVDNYKKRKAELEGEDPNAVGEDDADPDHAAARRDNSAEPQPSDGAGGAAGSRRPQRSPPPPSRSQPPSAEPWAASGSIFALMEEARQLEAAKQKSKKSDGRTKQEPETSGREHAGRRAEGSEKPRGKGQDREREWEDDFERGPRQDPGKARSGSGGPAFGPPRPPPRPGAAGGGEDAAGPGPGSGRADRQHARPHERDTGPVRKSGREDDRQGDRDRSRMEDRQRRRSPSPGGRSPLRDGERGWDRRAGADRGFGGGGDADREPARARYGDGGVRDRERSRSRERDRDYGRDRRGPDRERGRERDW